MGSTLEHGIYLPSEGEKNCYQGLAGNWNKVDGALGDVAELKQSIESKFTKEIVTELPTEDINPFCIYMILKTDPETDNVYDEWVYINNAWEYLGNTKVDMTQYYTKQEVNQLPAVASGVTATKVGNYDAHIANGDIHVTASDKAKWDTVALIKQLRLVNTQVGSATTIAFANIDDTNGIKVGDKCMDLDAKMFEITAVDTTNETVTVGLALIDLALDAKVVHTDEINSSGIGIIEAVKEVGGVDFNTLTTQGLYGANASGSTNNPVASPCVVQVIKRQNTVIQIANVSSSSAYKSRYIRYCADITAQSPVWQSWIKFATDDDVVHTSGNETVGGQKTLVNLLPLKGEYLGTEASNNGRTLLYFIANRDTQNQSGIYLTKFRQNKAQGSMSGNDVAYLSFDCLENSVRTNNGLRINFLNFVDDIPQRFVLWSGITESLLGTAGASWSDVSTDKINGLNPSSLGMPDLSNGIDISSYITDLTGTIENTYTPPVNGWVCVRIVGNGVSVRQDDLALTNGYVTSTSGDKWSESSLPVLGNTQVFIRCRGGTAIVSAKFYPCLGNV